MTPLEEKTKTVAWYDAPTIDGIKPYIKGGVRLIPNPAYVEAQQKQRAKPDLVNHPSHYCKHPSGIECITITENMNFCLGNAFKHLYRCTDKGNTLQDLQKAKWYIQHELQCRKSPWFHWERENYNAQFDGDEYIQQILAWETRLQGWMRQALERLYTGSVQKRGVDALKQASACVDNMIKIQEHHETR